MDTAIPLTPQQEAGQMTHPKPPHIEDLTYIECTSGLSSIHEGVGFVSVRCLSKEGNVMVGQVSVEVCREMGMQFLEAAEAAESDAAVYVVMRELGDGDADTMALQFITLLRKRRSEKEDP